MSVEYETAEDVVVRTRPSPPVARAHWALCLQDVAAASSGSMVHLHPDLLLSQGSPSYCGCAFGSIHI